MIPEFIAHQPERGALGCHLTGRPPLNYGSEFAIYYAIAASVISAATSTAVAYDAAQDQKQQVKQQGEANAQAAEAESARMQAESDENARRLAKQQRRAQAAQLAQMASTGFRLDTGTPLAISQDTEVAQARERSDLSYGTAVQQRGLLWDADQSRSLAAQQAGAIGKQQTAGLISGIGNMASTGFSVYGSSPYGNSGARVDRAARGV